ncbi:MAG TPA: hypothetical protein VLA04_04690 [Verrucomicrobiae bacterium]|nr:hypothetical protein [Verrucomicrobiae bacterium]
MEGYLSLALKYLLSPAHYLAGQIGLPSHLPAVELGVGLVFLASLFGLALLALYSWLHTKRTIALVTSVVLAVGGVIGLLTSVTVPHTWLYLLILDIVAADLFWRLLTRQGMPRGIRRAGTVWATASLLLSAGTPALFLFHTYFSEQRANTAIENYLIAERTHLLTAEQERVTGAVTTLSTSPQFSGVELSPGNPVLISLLQQMSVTERISYLVLISKSDKKVLARTQPAAAFGDTWPVDLSDITTGTASGITLSERAIPLVVSAHPLKDNDLYALVGGIQVDQTYLTTRVAGSKYPLFISSNRGITALAGSDGNILNALSSQSIDTYLADRTGKAGAFTLASNKKKYLVRTLPVMSGDTAVITLGAAHEDAGIGMRLRLDLVLMVAVAILILVLPALLWRKKEETHE